MAAGISVPILAKPDAGFRFDRWTVEAGKAAIANAASASTTVVLKAGDARVRALFKRTP